MLQASPVAYLEIVRAVSFVQKKTKMTLPSLGLCLSLNVILRLKLLTVWIYSTFCPPLCLVFSVPLVVICFIFSLAVGMVSPAWLCVDHEDRLELRAV